jgi:dolichyl-phosphate beta-glucosyltransferase
LVAPDRPFLSIIIPAYNEERRLASTLAAMRAYLERFPRSWELLVVDDGSRDRTIEVAEANFWDARCRVLRNPRNLGKGGTIRHGMLKARGRFRLFADADNSTPIEQADLLIEHMREARAAVAIGSRALPDSDLAVRQPLYRELMGRTFNLLVQLIAPLPGIRDTQCGFKVFTARAAETVFPLQTLDGFGFDVEILVLARRRRLRIVEVPVRWIDNADSRVSPVRDSLRMFRELVTVRLRTR